MRILHKGYFLLFIFSSIVFAFILVWLGDHGRIALSTSSSLSSSEIEMIGPEGAEKIYLYFGKSRGLIKSGNYTLYVSGDNGTYVATVTVGRFLRETNISLHNKKESYRRIVGVNPSPCMFYLEEKLYSVECGDNFFGLQEHVPSTKETPTYTQNVNSNDYFGEVVDLIPYEKNKISVLLKDSEGVATYALQTIDAGISSSTRQQVSVDVNKQYRMLYSGEGMLLYPTSFDSYVFNSVSGKNKNVRLKTPKNLTPTDIGYSGGTLIRLFSSQPSALDGETSVLKSDSGKSVVYVDRGDESIIYTFAQRFSKVWICEKHLCLIDKSGLNIYSMTGDTANLEYTVYGVTDVIDGDFGSRLITNEGVVNFNITKRLGYLEYSFGEFRYCGSGAANKGYLLCVIDKKMGKLGVFVNPSKTSLFAVDKAASIMSNKNFVDYVSAQGDNIYIVPKYPTHPTNNSDEEQEQIKIEVDKINKEIFSVLKQLSIPSSYHVVVAGF